MNLLFVCGGIASDNAGGSEIQLDYLARFLRDRGHRVSFFTLNYHPEFPEVQTLDGFTIYRNRSVPESLCWPLRLIGKLRMAIRAEHADMLYGRSIRSIFVAYTAAKRERRPYVYQLPFLFAPGASSLRSLCRSLWKFRNNPLNAVIAPRIIGKVPCLLANSCENAAAMERFFRRPVPCIYNLHPVPETDFTVKSDPPLVVWINNIKRLKRPEMFLEVIRLLRNAPCRFVMVGRMGTDVYSASIRNQFPEMWNFEYRGPQTQEQCLELLSRATLNIVTSESEGFPNGTIQGWLRGTPVITTIDCDSLTERERLGWKAENAVEIADKITHALAHPEELREIGERAVMFARRNFSIEENGEKYLQLFERVVYGKR